MKTAFAQRALDITDRATCTDVLISAEPVASSVADSTTKIKSLTQELDILRCEYAELKQAVYEAAQIQRKLCAPRELSWGAFEIAGEIFPVRHLCGDFFKVIDLGDALGLAVGDIAGKGMTAGIWQAHLMGLLERAARTCANPGDAVAEVNGELCRDNGTAPIMALFFARIAANNTLLYCNAGLPAPLLLKGGNTRLVCLEEGGPMLGVVKDGAFHTGSVTFDPGDLLIAYSDGVTECRNTADQEFEMRRLIDATKTIANSGASRALFSLLGTVLDFAGSCSPGDDMTLLVARCRPLKTDRERPRTSTNKDSSAPSRRHPRSAGRRKSGGEDRPS